MNLHDMLVRDEGWKNEAYPDPLTGSDPWTIGVGHTGPEVVKGLVWDDGMVDNALQLDIAKATQGCMDHFEPWFSQLNDARQAVLVAMCFQMGIGRLCGFRKMLDALRDQHFSTAAEEMRQSVWAHQTPKRAIRTAYQLESGNW